MDAFVYSAADVLELKGWNDQLSRTSFWSYVAAVIGHGVVQYAHERLAYVAEKSSVQGLLGNELLRTFHTFEQWQHAKQLWVLHREILTDHFNARTKELVQPSQ